MNARQTSADWVGIDVHVHTPESHDYRGNRDTSEFTKIIGAANAFGRAEKDNARRNRALSERPIGCIVFTDHNSINGFQQYRSLIEERTKLRDMLRSQDPSNAYLPKLEDELKLLTSVRVLMGIEISANPGIHLLGVFEESVLPKDVEEFLVDVYAKPYAEIRGDPLPTTACTIEVTLDRFRDKFGDRGMIIAPHVDGNRGAYQDLREFGSTRTAVLCHSVVKALSFNKPETRQRLLDFYGSCETKRDVPVALIQSSDFHGASGQMIGQPRTEVLVSKGHPTFRNIVAAFGNTGRVKCSIDFTQQEYDDLKEDEFTFSVDLNDSLDVPEDKKDELISALCAMLNSEGGVLEFSASSQVSAGHVGKDFWKPWWDSFPGVVEEKLQPKWMPELYRDFHFSANRQKLLLKVPQARKLFTAQSMVFVERLGVVRKATSYEIEGIVGRNIARRFAARFEGTLDEFAEKSALLAKVPSGIPILLKAQEKLSFNLLDVFEVELLEPANEKLEEQLTALGKLYRDTAPYGSAKGNATILWAHGPTKARQKKHYWRFTTPRYMLDEDLIRSCKLKKVEQSGIVIWGGGAATVIEPGYLASSFPALLLKPKGIWSDKVGALAAWIKSSFFIWYSSVHVGEPDLYITFQLLRSKLPLIPKSSRDFYNRLQTLTSNIVIDENKFMDSVVRSLKSGQKELNKLESDHNRHANAMCLSIDRAVYEYLGLSEDDARDISETMKNLGFTDFGLLEEEDE